MGKKDAAVKNFLEDNRIFADLFNGAVFEGRQVVKARTLTKEDPAHKTLISLRRTVGKERDLLRRASLGARYMVLGVEDQSKVHYGMTVRTMLYDALDYEAQCRAKALLDGKQGLTAEEILSGIAKGTKLMPVYTVVFYTGEDPWDGPKCLHDMLNMPAEMKNIVPDYPLKIVSVRDWDKPELFKTELGIFSDC
ncbi:MAG: Rpn family recombination-promoting nuclease/putative transposase [Lachnospiraceae bacterium]|nr:Rpn family recombination-promoting nuclease/putative transposase [Lachnospiraceae bacterium]